MVEQDDMKRQHERLKDDVNRCMYDRTELLKALGIPALAAKLSDFETQSTAQLEGLLNVEQKELPQARAVVIARRELLYTLITAYAGELDSARFKLKEFEDQHPLFLEAQPAKKSKGKSESADQTSAAVVEA